MTIKACPYCGAEYTDNLSTQPYTYCPHCGKKLEIFNILEQEEYSWTLTKEDEEKIRNRNKNIGVLENQK